MFKLFIEKCKQLVFNYTGLLQYAAHWKLVLSITIKEFKKKQIRKIKNYKNNHIQALIFNLSQT